MDLNPTAATIYRCANIADAWFLKTNKTVHTFYNLTIYSLIKLVQRFVVGIGMTEAF